MHLQDKRSRITASIVSIVAGIAILALKFMAYRLTGSAALKSDAYESTVNVVAALFALGAILFAEQPADEDHPYGHGKIENFSAAFEGGLITLAGILIIYDGISTLMLPPELKSLDLGLGLNVFAGVLNGFLGFYLISKGKKLRSRAIEADGHHVMSDFITSLALIVGVAVVWFTGWSWLDPVLAIAMGSWLLFIGFRLVKESAGALLDVEDPKILQALLDAANAERGPEIISLHGLRTLRSGRFIHADVHVVVPEFLQVRQGHDLIEDYFARIIRKANLEGEFHSHMDPCMRTLCSECSYPNCSIRRTEFVATKKFELATVVMPEPIK